MISVIVPIYNADKYVGRCVNSLRQQTYADIEIILVNDGSIDDSLTICNELAKSDRRIKVVTQSNQGVSAARNNGIAKANGEYICFVDSDDYVTEIYIESMIKIMLKEQADLVLSGRRQLKLDGSVHIAMPSSCKMIGQDIRNMFRDSSFDNTRGGPYCKLFKRSIINANNISFPLNIHYLEDAIFVLEYILKCKIVCALNEANYIYELHNGSLVFTIHGYDIEKNGINKFRQLYEEFQQRFNLFNGDDYWFESNLKFLLYRQCKALCGLKDKKLRMKELKNFDWDEYRRLKSAEGYKRRLLNLLTFFFFGKKMLVNLKLI